MKAFLGLIMVISSLFIMSCGERSSDDVKSQTEIAQPEVLPTSDALLRHVVLFNFNDSASDSMVTVMEDAFAALPDEIEEIAGFEWGTNNSPEGLNKGLTHCFLVTFESEAGRAAYLPHPAHQAFVKLIGPYVEDVTVVDYWAK